MASKQTEQLIKPKANVDTGIILLVYHSVVKHNHIWVPWNEIKNLINHTVTSLTELYKEEMNVERDNPRIHFNQVLLTAKHFDAFSSCQLIPSDSAFYAIYNIRKARWKKSDYKQICTKEWQI